MSAKDSKIRRPNLILIRSLFIITLFYCLRSTRLVFANGKEESFCEKRFREYDEERREYRKHCVHNSGGQSPSCCNIIKESLDDRVLQYHILCPGRGIWGPNQVPKSCADLYKSGAKQNGVRTIDPDGQGAFDVRCDMRTDGGGWTVFQRRMDVSVDFYLNWADYKNGFGNLRGEFWLGLDKINRLSKSGQDVLRVDLEDFEKESRYAKYNTFAMANETELYKLTVGKYSGNAGDSLAYHNGMKFSTKDKDNDRRSGTNCAVSYKGAWWYKSCYDCNLNGLYLRGMNTNQGVIWRRWKGQLYSLKKTEMKVRPRNF